MTMNDETSERFVRLLTRHEPELRRYVASLLPFPRDVDDVMQEAAAVLWRKAAEYDPAREFLPWALRFAYFEVLKWRRAAARRTHFFSEHTMELLDATLAEARPDEEARHRALEACLAKLGTPERELLACRYEGAGTIGELAQRVGRTPHQLYYALERVRAALLECVERALRREGWEPG